MCVCGVGEWGGGGAKETALASDNQGHARGMLPRKNFKVKSSEMARNASKTDVASGETWVRFLLGTTCLSFHVRCVS